nr:NADH dehydrogenase subunit 4 [Cardiastethus sp.]
MMMMLISVVFLIPVCLLMMWWNLVSLIMFLMLFNISKLWFMNYFSFISYSFGGDLLSLSLVILSFFILCLMIMASMGVYVNKKMSLEFMLINLFLLVFLILTFSCFNIFLFYLFFESSLIPTLLLIFGWGYQPERLSAGFYLLFYTLFASLPLLISIFYLYNSFMTAFFFLLSIEVNVYLYLGLILAFLVKLPIVFLHFWLPKAHVEAPVAGSMILAGILLKLGGYGLMRVLYFMNVFALKYNWIFMGFSLFGMIMVGLLCLIQVDIKSLIAYSSVAHMSLVICGILSLNYWGLLGSLVLMIGHGLCSSGMFALANITYERSHSRSFFVNKGLISFMPSMTLLWFLLSINNMASPPSLNLLGEIMLINSIMSWSSFSFLYLSFSSFLSCCYSMYLYSITQHGSLYNGFIHQSGGNIREYILILFHWLPLNFIILKSDMFLYWL